MHIIEEDINNLFSNCMLLTKVKLSLPKGPNTIKVKDLPYLNKLETNLRGRDANLEIYDLPCLGLLFCNVDFTRLRNPLSFNSTGSSKESSIVQLNRFIWKCETVRELCLNGVILDCALSDMIHRDFLF